MFLAFAVDSTGLPDVDFDIGESYAGLLPISSTANETRELFFWFFPSANPDATNEVTIWYILCEMISKSRCTDMPNSGSMVALDVVLSLVSYRRMDHSCINLAHSYRSRTPTLG